MFTYEYALEVKEYIDLIYITQGYEAVLTEVKKFHEFIDALYDEEDYDCWETYEILMTTLYGEDFFNCF